MIRAVMIKGKPNSERRACKDCYHCQACVGWWCTSDDAKEHRGTRIPGIMECSFWSPVRTIGDLSFFERHFGDYIKIKGKDQGE